MDSRDGYFVETRLYAQQSVQEIISAFEIHARNPFCIYPVLT